MISAWIRSSTRLAFTGSSWLTSTSTVGCSGLRLASDSSLSSRSGGQDQRRDHVAVLDLLLGLLARGDVDALDPRAELVAGDAAVDLLVAGADLELLVSSGGTSLRNATRGLELSAESAKPISTPSTTG